MLTLLKTSGRVAGMLLAAALLLPAQTRIAQPGTVNYTEGIVTLNGQNVTNSTAGSAVVAAGQILATQDGKAEMLLTPGVFLRLAPHSAVTMVSPSITDTRVDLTAGSAMLEAEQVEKENHLNVGIHGANVFIQKHGLYDFNADQNTVAVYDGKVEVQQNDRTRKLTKGDEVALGPNNPKLKTESFNVKNSESNNSLYAWSKLRSEYVAEANMSLAQNIYVTNPYWSYGTGWYWNPYFDSFAFMPGAGYFGSPFGWGFYSPAYWGGYYAPFYGFGHRVFLPGTVHAFNPRVAGRPGFRATAPSIGARPFTGMRGFNAGPRGFSGGGMRMGGRR